MQLIAPIFAETNAGDLAKALGAPGVIAVLCILGFAGLCTAVMQIVKFIDRFFPKDQPHPGDVQREAHDLFTPKRDFAQHVQDNTARHAQLFKAVERVEREARAALDERFERLYEERAKQLENLNAQLGFIRESIVEVKTEIKHLK